MKTQKVSFVEKGVCVLSHFSHFQLFVTQQTVALCPWGFSRQEYWSGLPCLPPGDLPDPGIEKDMQRIADWLSGFTHSCWWRITKKTSVRKRVCVQMQEGSGEGVYLGNFERPGMLGGLRGCRGEV